MSKIAVELLHAIGLLKSDNSVVDVSKIPQEQLKGMLSYYHQKRSEIADQEIGMLAQAKLKNAALVSSISAANSVLPLCPKLLIQEALVSADPLFAFSTPESKYAAVQNQGLGFPSDEDVDVERLQNKLLYFKGLAPFMEAGFLHSLPLSILHRPPAEIPIYAPKNLYRELVPDEVTDLIRASATVSPLITSKMGLVVGDEDSTERTRQVCINFKNDESCRSGAMYMFREMKILGTNPDGSYQTSQEIWNDEPLDQPQYDLWIEQSINRTVGNRLESIAKEMQLADFIGAPYLTESSFEANLLSKAIKSPLQTRGSAINFLEANIDRLQLNDPIEVYRMRIDNEVLLARFRSSLADTASQLMGLEGEEYASQARELYEREIRPQIEEINTATNKIAESTAKGAIQTGTALPSQS